MVIVVLCHVFLVQRSKLHVKTHDDKANEDYACVQDVSFPSEEPPPQRLQLMILNTDTTVTTACLKDWPGLSLMTYFNI